MTHILEGAGKDGSELIQVAESNILNRYTYDAFGNTIECEEQVHNRFRYNGEQYDPVTNQYYLRARFYNPAIARFTQEDTYYGDGLNLYQYCANNPVGYADPSGPDLCQTQIDLYNKYRAEGMKANEVNNVNNIIAIPHGKGTVHAKISGYYASIPASGFTNGSTVRQWLSGQSFQQQFDFGMNILKQYGDVIETSSGWKFIPFE